MYSQQEFKRSFIKDSLGVMLIARRFGAQLALLSTPLEGHLNRLSGLNILIIHP